jgi:hypothetical protein
MSVQDPLFCMFMGLLGVWRPLRHSCEQVKAQAHTARSVLKLIAACSSTLLLLSIPQGHQALQPAAV